jgi:DNA primase
LFKATSLFYQNNLPQVKDYLAGRHITMETAKKYELGYADNTPDLMDYLLGLNYSKDIIVQSGLGWLDRHSSLRPSMKNRLIIPIKNNYGQVISFTGRDTTGQAVNKYKHGHNNTLFNKSKVLWNLSNVLKQIQQDEMVVVVEGQMDALAVTEAGFPAVAILGSSLSDFQLKSLTRIAKKVYHLFDSDESGEQGLLEAFKKFTAEGHDSVFYAVTLPEKKDADDYIVAKGKEEFKKLIQGASPDTTAIVQALIKKHASSTKSKSTVLNRVISELSPHVTLNFSLSYRGTDLVERISEQFDIQPQILKEELYKHIKGAILKVLFPLLTPYAAS